jgi:hypothetical protein
MHCYRHSTAVLIFNQRPVVLFASNCPSGFSATLSAIIITRISSKPVCFHIQTPFFPMSPWKSVTDVSWPTLLSLSSVRQVLPSVPGLRTGCGDSDFIPFTSVPHQNTRIIPLQLAILCMNFKVCNNLNCRRYVTRTYTWTPSNIPRSNKIIRSYCKHYHCSLYRTYFLQLIHDLKSEINRSLESAGILCVWQVDKKRKPRCSPLCIFPLSCL